MKSVILLSLLLVTGLCGCQNVVKEATVQKDQQEAAVRVYVDSCWNQHNMLMIRELMTNDFKRNLNGISVANGHMELEAYIKNFIRAFPTLRIKVDDMIQKDQQVITTWSFEGTNTGEFAEYLPTGKKAKVSGVTLFQFNEEGKILREDTYYNELYLLQQLGYSLQPPNME
ncbi:MAG: SnoaL-like domain-containing protein [Eudoraea sp.]|nr:SnoaL-like domain-containing protein [Eudoraea sp.]